MSKLDKLMGEKVMGLSASGSFSAAQFLLDMKRMESLDEKDINANPTWLKLKDPPKWWRWWHWIIHPIRTYRIWKYLKSVIKQLHKEIDKPAMEDHFRDVMAYGFSIYKVNNQQTEKNENE